MCSIFTLPEEDVVFPMILSKLDVMDCFSLRKVSRDFKRLVDSYFKYMLELNLSKYARVFSVRRFKVLTEKCYNLRKIILTRCTWLNDDLIKPMFLHNSHISYLVLNDCDHLSTACLQNVIIQCKNLKTLKLRNCVWLTVGCLEAITLHQHALEDIDLSRALLHNSNSINCFFRKFPNLRNINLEHNPVTDSTLVVISQVCLKLENLNLQFCPHITDLGIRCVTDNCKMLKSLLILGCPKISYQCVVSVSHKVLVDMRQQVGFHQRLYQ